MKDYIADALLTYWTGQRPMPLEEDPKWDSLSVRAQNVLRRANITTCNQLIQWSADDLLYRKNCGDHTVKEICEFVGAMGLELSPMSHERHEWQSGQWYEK